MILHLSQLRGDLEKGLRPSYLIAGPEPFQRMEALQALYDCLNPSHQRNVIDLNNPAHWDELAYRLQSFNLFSSLNYFEVTLPAKISKVQNSQLIELSQQAATEHCLIFIKAQFSKEDKSSRWFEHFSHERVILTNPISREELPRFLAIRLSREAYTISPEALALFCEATEGNLLAAGQLIARLKLLQLPKQLDTEHVRPLLNQQTHFSLYDLSDALLQRDGARLIVILTHFEQVGFEGILVLWAIVKEIRLLMQLLYLQKRQGFSEAATQLKIWRRRHTLYQRALKTLNKEILENSLQQAFHIDCQFKGIELTNSPWDNLRTMCLKVISAL